MDSEIHDITLHGVNPASTGVSNRSLMFTGREKLLKDQWKIMEKKLSESAVTTLNVLNTTAGNLYKEIVIEKKSVEQTILDQLNSKVSSTYVTLGGRYSDLRKKIIIDHKLNKYFKLQEIEKMSLEEPGTEIGSIVEIKDKKRKKTEDIRKRLEDKKAGVDKEISSLKQIRLLNQHVASTIEAEFDILISKIKSKDTSIKPSGKLRSVTPSIIGPSITINDLQDLIYSDRYVELIALSFISATNLLTDIQIDENKMLNNEENKKLYELAMGISHLYDKLNPLSENKIELNRITVIDSNMISSEILEDLFNAKENFLRRLNFQPVFLSKNFPQLIFDNVYNKYLNINAIKPYRSQIEVLAGFIDANNYVSSNGFLCLLKTLTGEGKTSLIVSLANTVNKVFESRQKYSDKKMEIIFCCNDRLNTVSYQVGQYAHGMSVPFGIACEVDKINDLGVRYKDVHVNNNKNCKEGRRRLLTIADIVSTGRLLEKAQVKNREYILFFDEPTSFLDENNPELIQHLTNIFKHMPPNTILSSATLPKIDDIAPLTTYFNSKYPSGKILFVDSSKVKIGCQVNNFDGKLFIPNQNILYKYEMDRLIAKLMETSFVKKLYTPYVTSLLWTNIEKLIKNRSITVDKVENFKLKFGNPCNLNQEAVQNCAINYLEKIAQTDDSPITTDFNTYSDSDTLIEEPINFSKLIKYKETRFKTQTLIVTSNPSNFVKMHFEETFENMFKRSQELSADKSFDTFYDIYEDYLKQHIVYNEQISKIKTDTEKQRLRNQELIDSYKPIFNFERVNILGVTYYPEKIDYSDMEIEDNYLLIGLALGVGIYSPTTMSKRYTNEVLNLANEGKLAYIVADTDIAYGTNYAIEHIIIDDSCFTGTNAHSISTLFQVIARAGRVGKSWRAMIYCGNEVINILDNYIKENIGTNEAAKLNLAIEKITSLELEDLRDEAEKIQTIVDIQQGINADVIELTTVQASLNKDIENVRIEQQASAMTATNTTTHKLPLPIILPVREIPVSETVSVDTHDIRETALSERPVVKESVSIVEQSVPSNKTSSYIPPHLRNKPALPVLQTPGRIDTVEKPTTWRERVALKQKQDLALKSR